MGVVVMVRSALTVEEKTEIWRGYGAGASLRSISRTLGRSMGPMHDDGCIVVAKKLSAAQEGYEFGPRAGVSWRANLALRMSDCETDASSRLRLIRVPLRLAWGR
jgi:hypothetical protein